MALPNASLIQTAIQNLYLAFSDNKTERGQRTAVNHLGWLTGTLNFLYGVPTNIAVTDAADADVTAFIGGGEGDAFSVDSIFRLTTAGDLTNNAFGTAKNAQGDGSVVAIGDIYVISGANAVTYLGNNSGVAFDNAGESVSDFTAIV